VESKDSSPELLFVCVSTKSLLTCRRQQLGIPGKCSSSPYLCSLPIFALLIGKYFNYFFISFNEMWPAHRVEISTRFSETTTTANKNAFINLIQQIQSKMLRYLWTSLFFLFCTISAGRPSICLYFYYFFVYGKLSGEWNDTYLVGCAVGKNCKIKS